MASQDLAEQVKQLQSDVVSLRLMLSVVITASPYALETLKAAIPQLDDATLFMDMDEDQRTMLRVQMQTMVAGCELARQKLPPNR